MDKLDLLIRPFAELGFSKQFIKQSSLMGFNAVDDIILVDPMKLVENDDFTYQWLGELVRFLIENDSLYLLQPAAGKNYD